MGVNRERKVETGEKGIIVPLPPDAHLQNCPSCTLL